MKKPTLRHTTEHLREVTGSTISEYEENDIIELYAACWNKRSAGKLESYLADDFHYSSFWAFEELDKVGYLDYFAAQLLRIEEKGANVKARVKDKALIVIQDGNNVAIIPKFENGRISRADMVPASFVNIPHIGLFRAPKFNLIGQSCFYNDCPLLNTHYVNKIPPKITIRRIDYNKKWQGDSDPYISMTLRKIAERSEWLYMRELSQNNKKSFELLKDCYEEAVKDGLFEAANNLGIITLVYEDNADEGKKWLNYAACHGSQNAMINMFSLLWKNEEKYADGIAMLEKMFDEKNPSLSCLWNLSYLYYKGEEHPNNPLIKNEGKAKEILSFIANYDKDLICENEKRMPKKAQLMLDYIEYCKCRESQRKSVNLLPNQQKQKDMISKELFIDNISRKFVPYKGYFKVLEDGTEIIDDTTNDSKGPFQVIRSEFRTLNLQDKDGHKLLPNNVRKISYYDEGYYLLEDNSEDELPQKYAGTDGFPSKEYVSSMNVKRNDGTMLSEKWYKMIIPGLGFLRVTYDGKRWENVKLSGEPFIVESKRWENVKLSGEPFLFERYLLKFGCYIAPSSHGYAIYNSLNEKITADYKSIMWAAEGLWLVRLLYKGKYQSFFIGQGDAIIDYAHEVLIKTNVIAMLEKDGIWYIFDSLGRTTECLRWNPEY